jgi:hypothetical protein
MDIDVIISLLALVLAAVASGALIAMFATHCAPEGFEDASGCHLSRRPTGHAEES